jgi:hypothetical protein
MDISNLVTLPNLGIGSAIAGVIAIIVWVLNFNSPEQRNKRLRVEKAKLEERKKDIEEHQPTAETSAELEKIEKRIEQINIELGS